MTMRLTTVISALAGAVLAVGCAPVMPPSTSPVAALQVPTDGASVVFVRPVTPCDTGDYTILVDDTGRFIGNVAPGTSLVTPVKPGLHPFYAWSNLDLRVEKIPNFNPVAATLVRVTGPEPQYIAIEVNRPTFNCTEFALVDLLPIQRGGPRWGEMERWMAASQPVRPDLAAGQAEFDRKPVYVELNLEFGRAKLRRELGDQLTQERIKGLQAERDR